MVTGEGDRLNLKSKLSQYVSLANIFSNGEIPNWRLLHTKKKIDKLMDYMITATTDCITISKNQNQGSRQRPLFFIFVFKN